MCAFLIHVLASSLVTMSGNKRIRTLLSILRWTRSLTFDYHVFITRSKRKSEHQIGKSFRICQCNEPASILLLCLREVLNSAKRATMKFWPFTPSLSFSFSPPFDSSRTHLQLFKSSFKSRQIKRRTHILPCKTSRHVGLWKWHYCNSNIFQNHFTLHKLQSSSYVQSASYESDAIQKKKKKNQIDRKFFKGSHVLKFYMQPCMSRNVISALVSLSNYRIYFNDALSLPSIDLYTYHTCKLCVYVRIVV